MFRSLELATSRILVAVIPLLALESAAEAQRIVVMHVAVTDDPNIGRDCHIDQANIRDLFAHYPDLDRITQFIAIRGPRANYNTIVNQLNALQVGPDDAVMFYYSGHGAENKHHQNYCMLSKNDRPLFVSQVSQIIARKRPRLNLVIADMCSVVMRPEPPFSMGGPPERVVPPSGIPPAYVSLFLESRGPAIIISSSSNQVAVGDLYWGGHFHLRLRELHSE
jgi:hypothetical protein